MKIQLGCLILWNLKRKLARESGQSQNPKIYWFFPHQGHLLIHVLAIWPCDWSLPDLTYCSSLLFSRSRAKVMVLKLLLSTCLTLLSLSQGLQHVSILLYHPTWIPHSGLNIITCTLAPVRFYYFSAMPVMLKACYWIAKKSQLFISPLYLRFL